jgi:zinc protease
MMRSCLMLALAVLASVPNAVGAPLEGRTPKGVKYRFEYRPKIDTIAVAYMFADPSLATPDARQGWYYGHPALWLGSGGEERETVLRRLREAGVEATTSSPTVGVIGGTLVFPADKLELATRVLADAFQKADYPSTALKDRYTKWVKSWRDKYAKEPINQIHAAAAQVLLADYPFQRQYLIPQIDEVQPPPQQTLIDWRRKTLGRNNVLVAIAGKISEGDAGSFIDRVFGLLPEVAEVSKLAEPPLRTLEATIKIEQSASQVYVRSYALVPRFNDDPEKAIALAVAVQAFGSGPGSLLHRSIRVELGAAYSTSAALWQVFPASALFVTTLQLDPEKAPEAIARLKSEYDRLRTKGL